MMIKMYYINILVFFLGLSGMSFGQEVRITSETGKNFSHAEVLYFKEGKVREIQQISLSGSKIKVRKNTQIAIKLPGHLPLIYVGKDLKIIDLTKSENVRGAYKIKNGKVCAVAGDFNNDYQINAMDLFLFQKYQKANNPLADLNGDGKINEKDLEIVMENNDNLYRTDFSN